MGSDLDRLSVTITKAKLPKACCSCCSKHHESTVDKESSGVRRASRHLDDAHTHGC